MDEKSALEERLDKLEEIPKKFEKELKDCHVKFSQLSEDETVAYDFEKFSELTTLYSKIEELTNFVVFLRRRCINITSQLKEICYQDLSEDEKLEVAEYERKLREEWENNHGFRK